MHIADLVGENQFTTAVMQSQVLVDCPRNSMHTYDTLNIMSSFKHIEDFLKHQSVSLRHLSRTSFIPSSWYVTSFGCHNKGDERVCTRVSGVIFAGNLPQCSLVGRIV